MTIFPKEKAPMGKRNRMLEFVHFYFHKTNFMSTSVYNSDSEMQQGFIFLSHLSWKDPNQTFDLPKKSLFCLLRIWEGDVNGQDFSGGYPNCLMPLGEV